MTCIFSLDCMTFRLLVAWYQSGYPGQCGATWWPTKFKLDSIPECYFICDLFDNIAPLKYLGETCYVEFTRRCPTEVARGAKRWETRQICFLPSLWYVWQNTSFTNMNFFGQICHKKFIMKEVVCCGFSKLSQYCWKLEVYKVEPETTSRRSDNHAN